MQYKDTHHFRQCNHRL